MYQENNSLIYVLKLGNCIEYQIKLYPGLVEWQFHFVASENVYLERTGAFYGYTIGFQFVVGHRWLSR